MKQRLARAAVPISMEMTLTHTIAFRRPELPYVLSTMSVPPDSDVALQVRHLEDLGYKIVEVSPPLIGYGPPQNPQGPALRAIDSAEASLR